MARGKLVSEREVLRAIRLAQKQPEASPALQKLLEKANARIVKAVMRDQKVTRRLEGVRFRVVGADWRHDKLADAMPTALRLAEVGIYDYDHNVLVVPVVDIYTSAVVDIEERPGLQPPLTEEEIEEAKAIALADPQFESLKRRRGLAVTAFPARAAFNESHPAYGHRCFRLYFWTSGKRPQQIGQAVVDLSTRQLIPGDEEPSEIGEAGG